MKKNKKRVSYSLLLGLCSTIVLAEQFDDSITYIELGSRGAPKTITETAAPIDVIENWEIERTGVTETGRLIQRLVASFNFPTSTVSDASDAIRPGTLRGMGPDQILVLINGKRLHNTALTHVNGSVGRGSPGIDFNAIPVTAIERIEVLRDGAAAQYGSDAIAGVINIILKGDTGKTSVQITAGQTYSGDGDQLVASANSGLKIGDGGFLNLSFEKRDRDPTEQSGLDPRQQYPTLANGSDDPREATFNRRNHRYGDAESNNYSLYLNGAVPIGEGEIYTTAGYTRREAESGGFYRRALDDRSNPLLYPNGFLPLMNTTTKDYTFALGYRLPLNENWDLDTSIVTGGNSLNYDINNSVNISLGAASPTSADAGTLNFNQTTFNADLTGLLDFGLHSPVYMALGFEARQDSYEIEAGEFASYANGPDDNIATASLAQSGRPGAPGIQLFPGFRPSNEVDENRHNYALYIELENNLTDDFLIGLAGRYENYSDVGSNFTGKISLRYQLMDSLAVRGSFSTGFRAPSLQQANFNTVNTQFIDDGTGNVVGVEVGTFQNDSAVAKALGVPSLDNETSLNGSFGLVFTPTESFTLATDLYRIEIKDRIILSGIFRPEATGGPIATALSPFGIGGAQFFSNAIDTITEGLDIVSSYQHNMGSGYLNLSAAAHWNRTKIDGRVASPSGLNSDTLYNRVEQVRLEKGQPRQTIVIGLNYDWQQFSFTLRTNRYGPITSTESASDPSRDQKFSAKWVTDLMLSYRPSKQFTLSLGADNIFDSKPEKNKKGENFNGIFPYNRRSTPFGYNGGFYYARAKYDF